MQRRRVQAAVELDLIPVLSLVVHLVPMLLLSVRFVTLAEHPVDRAPVEATEAPSREKLEAQEEERVVVRITATGFAVRGAGDGEAQIACAGSCTPGDYDYRALGDAMVAAKGLHPRMQQVIVAPDPGVPYAVIIGVMDATRSRRAGDREELLFLHPVLVTGAGERRP
ncbi:MAG: biopolymer transporter ExbD [Deltaproteobacteria bacterium]|nr:biopolymer transporter ExbD [Deltaproteobacteria bacterium]